MKKYKEYQVSPVLWNKQFPKHWKFERGKNLYYKENRIPSPSDNVVTCFRDGTVTLRKNRRTTGFTESLKEIGYQGIRKGDLVIHVMDAFAGAIGVSDSDGKGTPVYSVCTAKVNINNYYYAYLLRDIAIKGYIQSLYRGVRERSSEFRFDVFASQYYPIPPRQEQDQIVRFLDWKVSAINRLINIKKQEIEGLRELEKTTINKAVTRGINNNTLLKNSGIDWIGNIPKHWSVIKLKRVSKERKEKHLYTPNSTDEYIGLENVNGYANQLIQTQSEYEKSIQSFCHKGDLLFGKLRPYLAKVIIAPYDSCCTNEMLVLHSFNGNINFLRYVMVSESFIRTVNSSTYGAKMPRANSDYIMNTYIPLPPTDEQNEIVEYLDKKIGGIDSMIEKNKKQIALLQELKTRLISDTVTGQIDVRNVVVPEYEYTAENTNPDVESADESDAVNEEEVF